MAAKCILLSSVSRHLDGAVECVVDCHVMSLSDITRHWHCTAIPIDPQFASQWICHQFYQATNIFSSRLVKIIFNSVYGARSKSLESGTFQWRRAPLARCVAERLISVTRCLARDDEYNAGDLSHRSHTVRYASQHGTISRSSYKNWLDENRRNVWPGKTDRVEGISTSECTV